MSHFLLEALRANLVMKEPFLQGGAINLAGPSTSKEMHCLLQDLLLVAGNGHRLEQFRAIGVSVKGAILVLLAEDVEYPRTCLGAGIVGCIENFRVAVGHGPNGSTELARMHHQVESPPHRVQLEVAVGIGKWKAIFHGSFLHLASMRDQTSVLTLLMVFFKRTRRRMSSAKMQVFLELHPCSLTLRQRALCKARNCLAHQPFGRL